jgi:uncharacterized membrane protein
MVTTAQRYARVLVPLAFILVFGYWFWFAPPGLFGKADAIGYAVCHRIDERSLHVFGQQFALCARCSGMYLGAMLGLIFQAFTARRRGAWPTRPVIVVLALFFVAFAVDGSNSYLYLLKEMTPGALAKFPNLYIPNNALRLLTGTGMGLGLAAALFPAFNQTMWRDWSDAPALGDLKQFSLLLALTIIMDLLVLTDSPIALLPAAFIGPVGVLVILTMVYSMVWAMLMRDENRFLSLRDMLLPLLAGLTLAFIQITAIDVFRFWLTGTWGAFPLK